MAVKTTQKNTVESTEKQALSTGRQGKLHEGVVVKAAMKDTCTVSVERYVKHPKYKKFQRLSKKFLVHNPGNTAVVGDRVIIRESRPISKLKRFIIVSTQSSASKEN